LQEQFTVSERRACQVTGQPRTSQRYQAKPRDDERALVKRMLELVRQRPRFGYRRIAALLRKEFWRASATRIYRLWRREGLKVPQKKRKRRRLGKSENGCHRRRAEHKDHVWCWDFVFDHATSGSTLKWLSIVDEHTRECLALKVDRSITSEDVIDRLAELFAMRGVPRAIRSDNGPEFIARAVQRCGFGKWRSRRFTLNQAALGRMATPRASIVRCEPSSWRWKCLRIWPRRGSLLRPGETITTITGRTARWGTRPQPSSWPAVLLPFGLRPHSSSTADQP
jgi:hypothetical protein